MNWLVKQIAGEFGPFILGAMLAGLLGALGWGAVQTARLHGAQEGEATAWRERDAALTNLGRCQVNTANLEAAIAERDGLVRRQSEEATTALADQQAKLDAALAAGKAADARIAALRKPLAGADQCIRLLELAERIP